MSQNHRSSSRRPATQLLLAGFCCAAIAISIFLLSREPKPADDRMGQLEQRAGADVPQTGMVEAANERLENELRESRTEAFESAAKAQALERQLAKAETKTQPPAKPAAWLRDPDMLQVLKTEAKNAAARSAASLMDAGLAQHLGLSEEQADRLKELLNARASIVWDQMMIPMTIGQLDGPGKVAAGKTVKQSLERNAAEIRALVGDRGFEAYQWFDKTQSDRDMMKRVTPQFAKAGQDLSEEQQNGLLAVMIEERTNFSFQHELGDPMKMDFERWDENFTDEKVNMYFRDMTVLNERIAQRAQTVLTPDQAVLLRELHAEHLRRAKFTVQSTKAMMGQKN